MCAIFYKCYATRIKQLKHYSQLFVMDTAPVVLYAYFRTFSTCTLILFVKYVILYVCWRLYSYYTDSQKHESTLLHTYVLNEFLTADNSCTTKYFEKSIIEVRSSHFYASFGTFCAQIEKCMKTVKWLFSKENDVDFEFFRKFKISLCLE